MFFFVFSSVKVLSGVKQPAVPTDSTELLSSVQRPLSAISAPSTTTTGTAELLGTARHSVAITTVSVPVTSEITATVSGTVSTSVDSLPTSQQPSSTAVSAPTASIAENVDSTRDVPTTSSTTALVGTSSILAQLSYAQPSVERLLRRKAANAVTNRDTSTVTTSTQGPTHLLSSATQAALAAIASTPRR